ncbi:TPA: four helix bundle protein [Candidatus Saccharibacteria bacterium]|nr:four helix bundle protein [Candidatus Saccharibacteria bacterium]HIO87504.1 four helix bundle protein [Candidatus Saccharibacteria bacterium]
MSDFIDLVAWQKSHTFILAAYKQIDAYPSKENFGLTSQTRRALVSITSNIAEGFGRSTSPDRLHFYIIAQGSLIEVQNQLLLAKDLGYLKEAEYATLKKMSYEVRRLLGGLIKSTKQGKYND